MGGTRGRSPRRPLPMAWTQQTRESQFARRAPAKNKRMRRASAHAARLSAEGRGQREQCRGQKEQGLGPAAMLRARRPSSFRPRARRRSIVCDAPVPLFPCASSAMPGASWAARSELTVQLACSGLEAGGHSRALGQGGMRPGCPGVRTPCRGPRHHSGGSPARAAQ